MAAKPTLDRVRWAETAGGTPAAGMTEPTSGKKDTGWAVGELPPRETFNWWEHEAYLWFKYLSDGALTGDHSITGNTILEKAAATDSSLFIARDSFANVRTTIDHLGLPGGQVTDWIEDWRQSGVTVPPGWIFNNSGSGTSTSVDPVATDRPYRTRRLSVAASSGSQEITTEYLTAIDANTSFAMEQIVRTGGAVDSGTSMRGTVGLVASAGTGLQMFFAFDPDSHANIRTLIDGVFTASSVAIAINTTYRLRAEFLGDNMHAGSGSLVRYFINGVLVNSGAVTATGTLAYYARLDNNSTATAYDFYLGPAKIRFAERPSGDAL